MDSRPHQYYSYGQGYQYTDSGHQGYVDYGNGGQWGSAWGYEHVPQGEYQEWSYVTSGEIENGSRASSPRQQEEEYGGQDDYGYEYGPAEQDEHESERIDQNYDGNQYDNEAGDQGSWGQSSSPAGAYPSTTQQSYHQRHDRQRRRRRNRHWGYSATDDPSVYEGTDSYESNQADTYYHPDDTAYNSHTGTDSYESGSGYQDTSPDRSGSYFQRNHPPPAQSVLTAWERIRPWPSTHPTATTMQQQQVTVYQPQQQQPGYAVGQPVPNHNHQGQFEGAYQPLSRGGRRRA